MLAPMARLSGSSGLTILGVLVASAAFATILVASFGLVARTTREVGRSRENFTATNLAREGLELVQFIRDSNMQLCTPGNTNAVCSANPAWTGNVLGGDTLCDGDGENQLIVDRHNAIPGGVRVQKIAAPGVDQLFLAAGNHYQHHAGAATTPSYSRRITVDCSRQAAANNEHIVVISAVTWANRGEDHTIELRSHLYNWYQ